jgi:predicted nucleic acid-binding protein
VLRSFYKLPRAGIRDRILSLFQSPGLEVAEVDLLLIAINDFADKNVGFIDAYNAAWATKHGITDVYTYDRRHYSRLPGIRVLAPK